MDCSRLLLGLSGRPTKPYKGRPDLLQEGLDRPDGPLCLSIALWIEGTVCFVPELKVRRELLEGLTRILWPVVRDNHFRDSMACKHALQMHDYFLSRWPFQPRYFNISRSSRAISI